MRVNRLKAALRRTLARRPDLLEGRAWTVEERHLLDELADEADGGGGGSGG